MTEMSVKSISSNTDKISDPLPPGSPPEGPIKNMYSVSSIDLNNDDDMKQDEIILRVMNEDGTVVNQTGNGKRQSAHYPKQNSDMLYQDANIALPNDVNVSETKGKETPGTEGEEYVYTEGDTPTGGNTIVVAGNHKIRASV